MAIVTEPVLPVMPLFVPVTQLGTEPLAVPIQKGWLPEMALGMNVYVVPAEKLLGSAGLNP